MYNILNENGEPFVPAFKGDNGKSAYEIAVEDGFVGTEEEWLESLKGNSAGPFLKDPAKTYLVIKIPSDNDTFRLLTGDNGNPIYTIEWGDGTSDNITGTANPSHEYATAGMYLITISNNFSNGVVAGWNPDENKDKIIEVHGGSNYPLSIGSYAFFGCRYLTTAHFPNATSIGGDGFGGCTSLTRVNIPNATSISIAAFRNCTNLTTLRFPNATDILSQAFEYCSSLKELTIGNVTTTGTGTRFAGVKLINLKIAQDVDTDDIERIKQFYSDNDGAFTGAQINSI